MACLVPQFKCPSADVHFRHNHPHHLKARDHACFRSQCVLTQMTAVIDVEQLQITSPTYPTSSATVSPLTYLGSIGPPVKRDSEVTFAEETLLTSEEALIAAASAEAIALARVAAEVAKDAAQMTGNDPSVKSVKPEGSPCDIDILRLESVWLSNMEHATTVDRSLISAEEPDGDTQYMLGNNTGISNITGDKDITARSGRQNERRARRARAVDKATATVFPIKSGSSNRKKRSVAQEIDYSDPLRYLRGTTSTSKLLTAAEELELSEGIQDLLKLDRLQEELTERNCGKPTFSQWASAAGVDQKTLRKRLNYGARCKDKMVKNNVRLVISIAKNYQGSGMNLQDLVQEGCRGLIKGAEKFDASKGFKFSTYAHWWIKQAIRKSLSNQSRTIRLPFHMVDATYRVREARKQFFTENRKYPNDEEIAKVTGLSMRRLTAVMLTPKPPRSLDQKIGINLNLKPSEVIAHPESQSAEHMLIRQFMKHDLNKVLDTLNQREKQVVRMRFGLDDGRMKTLQEIGESMGVSRERIRQIESCAFRKLKSKRRSNNLQQYILP